MTDKRDKSNDAIIWCTKCQANALECPCLYPEVKGAHPLKPEIREGETPEEKAREYAEWKSDYANKREYNLAYNGFLAGYNLKVSEGKEESKELSPLEGPEVESKIAAIIEKYITIEPNSGNQLTRYRHISAAKEIISSLKKDL